MTRVDGGPLSPYESGFAKLRGLLRPDASPPDPAMTLRPPAFAALYSNAAGVHEAANRTPSAPSATVPHGLAVQREINPKSTRNQPKSTQNQTEIDPK